MDVLTSSLDAKAWATGQPAGSARWDDATLQRAADGLIGLACLVISAFLVLRYLRPWRRREVPYCSIVWMIAGFLLLCGISRSLDTISAGPVRSLAGVVSLLLAVACWTAVLGLARLVRKTHPPCDPHEFVKELTERRRAEEALRQSEVMARKLALVAGRTENAVIITDPEGKIEWVNDAFSRTTGYSLEEALGRMQGALLEGPETVPATVDFMKQRMRAGEGFRTEVLNYAKSGRKYLATVELQPVRDDAGRLTNFMAVESDISERKRAERRLEVQQVSMQILAGCGRLDEAIPSLLSTIGRTLDFDVAEYWAVNPQSGKLRAAARPWTSHRVGSEWSRAARDLELPPGVGLAGRIWAAGGSAWIDDLIDDPSASHPGRELARHSGLRSAFGFPIVASETGPIIGVMTFLSRESLACDEPLLQAMTTLGRQIGLFVERRRTQTELVQVNARLNAVLAAATQVSIIATDPDGLITVFNPGAERMLGYTAGEMIGRVTPLILHDPREVKAHAAQLSAEYGTRIAGFDALVERARRGGHDVREWTYIRKDGKSLTVLLAVTAVFDPVGRINGFLGIATDVSERRRLEDELRKRASELAEADIRKNEFLAMLGHELRNPLAPIRNAVKIMKQRDSNDPTLCWAREVIDQQMRQVAQLVDDLLEISRVTRGKVRLQREVVDVGTIVAYALESSRPIIDKHRHRLSIGMPAQPYLVDADPVRMGQVLSNLLHNAAKYTPEGGQIRLVVTAEAGTVRFRVRDNGIGIPSEMLSRVFDLFTQIDTSLDRSQGGLGLGLTLVRSLVEMHGGSVQAASEGLDKGSEFTVILPLWKPGEVNDAPSSPASPSLKTDADGAHRKPFQTRKVLVVDDNLPSAKSLEMLLSIEGHEVQVVHDGPSALQAVKLHRHEVVLMDIGLPEMDGYEVARRLRQDPELTGLLLVAITGYAEDEARRRSSAAGFDRHMVKPVDPDVILSLLAPPEWSGSAEPACVSAGSSSDHP